MLLKFNFYRQFKIIFKDPIIWMAIMAAILYCSWPLGFLLNPAVAHHALASQLEASGQPYNWLFISLDVLSGIALLIGGCIQWARSKGIVLKLSIAGYIIFALLVILAAIVPFNCNSMASSCAGLAHSPLIIIHGMASIVSVTFLLFSLMLLYKFLFDNNSHNSIKLLLFAILSVWGLIGLSALFVGRHHRADENFVEDIFITICSFSVLLSAFITQHFINREGRRLKTY